VNRRYLYVFGLLLVTALMTTTVPAGAQTHRQVPQASVSWAFGPPSPFFGTRFDGAYIPSLNRVYFLGYRDELNNTIGEIWYFDIATQTYVDTGKSMPTPISNYEVAPLTDSHGLGLYTFGGRDQNGAILTTVQVYYPATNNAFIVASDPWPGTTPSACVSLPAMGVVTIHNRAIVMGGSSFSTSVPACVDDNSTQTWIYNPMGAPGSRWLQGPNLNLARGYITAAVLNGRVYAIGGDVNVAGTLNPQTIVEAWKPPTGGWNDAGVADLPEACDESQAFPFTAGPLAGDIVMATCGQWPNGNADTNIYSSSSNSWSLGGTTLDAVRNEAGEMIKVGSAPRIYILGGYQVPAQTVTNESEIGTPGPLSGAQGAFGTSRAPARPDRLPPTN